MTKALLAYLVDRNGVDCNVAEIAAVLFEDNMYESYFRGLRKDLLARLQELGKKNAKENALSHSFIVMSISITYTLSVRIIKFSICVLLFTVKITAVKFYAKFPFLQKFYVA